MNAANPKRMETIVKMTGVTKRFAQVLALDNVNFEVGAGTFHCLLGENGAGKTTLMNILSGLYQPDQGQIEIHGKKTLFKGPLDAINCGVGMVHQFRKLILTFNSVENMFLGDPRAGILLDFKKEKEIASLFENFQVEINLRAHVWQLSAAQRLMVELVKLLYRGIKVLILDEPTSVLTDMQMKDFFDRMREFANTRGITVIIITHKLPVALDFTDRITVIREGRVAENVESKHATMQGLTKLITGGELTLLERVSVDTAKPVLEVIDLSALSDEGVPALKHASFVVHEGEIFAVAGVAGNGQQELAEVIMGLRELTGGRLILRGEDIGRCSIQARWKKGIAYVTPRRVEEGSVADYTLTQNVMLNLYTDPNYSSRGIVDSGKLRIHTEHLLSEFHVSPRSPDAKAKQLSGGNLQKLILGRVLSLNSQLLVASLPTEGLDVKASLFVREKLLDYKKQGKGILLISEDIEEVLSISDTIAPIYEGKLCDIVRREEATKAKIIAAMIGKSQVGVCS